MVPKQSSDEHTHTLSPADEKKAMVTVANNHLVAGKRHLILNEIPQAVDALARACNLYATRYGELADELATPHLYYGKALLQMGRIENGVLGNAVQQGSALSDGKDDVDTTDECSTNDGVIIEEAGEDTCSMDRAALRREVEDAMGKNNIYEQIRMRELCVNEEPGNEAVGVDTEYEECASQDDTCPDDVSQDEADDDCEDITDEPAAKADACDSSPDEESNLEHAWKILELAAVIYTRLGDLAGLKLAETKIALGHVSMETEQYEQAAGDFMAALDLQKKFLKMDDRRIAETVYHIGLAHSFNNNFPESITWYKQSRDSLQQRIANLDEAMRMRAAEEFGEIYQSGEVEEMEAEKRELNDLVMLDMNSKIEDVEQSMKFYFASNTSKQSSGNGPFDAASGSFDDVNQISSQIVVKKVAEKRKSETDESNELKKPHLIAQPHGDLMEITEASRSCEAQG